MAIKALKGWKNWQACD